jgi:ABC-type polysaccharide/polyol phosphate export permease
MTTQPVPGGGSLRRSVSIQLRVLWALVLREIITRYGRHNIGFLWLFVEPMIFTLGVASLWTISGLSHGSDLPIVAFALTGYSTVLLWRNMPGRTINSVQPNSALMFHRNVRIIDIFLSRVSLEAIGATMSFVILGLVLLALEYMQPPENLLKIVQGWLLTAWFGASLAILLGSLAERSEIVEKLWHPSSYLLFPLSGAAFLVEALPTDFQRAILWLPMVHGVEMIREGWFGSIVEAHYDAGYLVTANMLLTLLGLSVERRVSREFVPE